MLINNVFNYYSNNGDGSFNKYSVMNTGFQSPKDKDLSTLIFEDGVLWGCYQGGTVKVGGSVYRHGLQAGPILVNGTASVAPVADDPVNPANRVYRVRRDIKPMPGVTDPTDPLAAGEWTIIRNGEIPLVGQIEHVDANQLLQQYWNDWLHWPAAEGAPYTDVDQSGTYDPAIDIPGVPLADQTLWYVANDLDAGRTLLLAASTPIGLEMQKTIWAYNLPGALGNTIFAKTTLINKSGIQLDSMYVAQWSDPDLGYAGDDYVGCDTVLNLGYAYNATPSDVNFASYGLVPPAVGFDFVQGPMVHGAATDTAVFGFARRPGFRNLSMTAFVFFTAGSPIYTDPVSGAGADMEWYRLLQGTIAHSGTSFMNPVTGKPTTFTLSGDPVTGTGWIDGNPAPAADRRMHMSSGPFTMAPGDTQEIVVACLVSRGADYLSSVASLRDDDRLIQRVYNSLNRELPPKMSYAVSTSSNQATISFLADARIAAVSTAQLNLKTYGGASVAAVPLADDGLHGDGGAGDGLLGGSVTVSQQQGGLHAEAVIAYPNGDILPWGHAFDDISTTKLALTSHSVVSDNINNDGVSNPGENVRYVFSLTNTSSLAFAGLSLTAFPVFERKSLTLNTLGGNATFAYSYNDTDPSTYLAFDVPGDYRDSTISIVVVITDTSHNLWKDTIAFPVRPLKQRLFGTPLTRVVGKATGEFAISIVDSAQVKNHLYVLRGVDTVGFTSGYTLKDSTTGLVLIQNHPLPDTLGHTSPIVDGFKVLLGTVDTQPGMKSWSIPSGSRRFSPVGGALFGLEGFSNSGFPAAPQDRNAGTIGIGQNFQFGSITTSLPESGYHDVLITWAAVPALPGLWDPKAAPTDTNYSRAYRYLRAAALPPAKPEFAPWITNPLGSAGYAYQSYDYGVPFSVWDQSTTPPTRLAVGHLENNAANGLVDGRYFPGLTTVDNGAADGPREFLFIFATPYTTTPDPQYTINFLGSHTPLMWVMTCTRRTDPPYSSADQFAIITNHMPSSQDMWTFNPSVLTSVKPVSIPATFALMQNFPNPFNPSTTIHYELPVPGMVTMKIYNILGQEIRTLVNEVQNAGSHAVIWNSQNDAGHIVASGVYLYRCTAFPSNRDNPFSQTLKMVHVK
jgi:hypothetical protein